MMWSKAKMAIVVGMVVLLATATTVITAKKIYEQKMYAWQVKDFDFPAILEKVPPQVTILPTKFADHMQAQSENGKDARQLGVGTPFHLLILMAFQVERGSRIIFPADLPQTKFDYIANISHDSSAALQKEIKRKLGVTGKFETLETDVLLLKVKHPNSPALKVSIAAPDWSAVALDGISNTNQLMSAFAAQLEDRIFRIPVINQTGLTQAFDFHLTCDPYNKESVKNALLDQLGLELVPTNMPIEMLVIEKVK